MSRRLWTTIHTLAGMGACLLLSFVLITGTLATLSNEMDWLANPAIRAKSPTSTLPLPWAEFYRQIQDHYPEATLLQLMAPFDRQFNAQALLQSPSQTRFRVYLDPSNGQITGEGRWLNWQRFFRQTHRHLMLPTRFGVPIVGATALLLLALLISGLKVYKGWYRGWLHWPSRGRPLPLGLPKPKQAAQRVRRSYRYWGDWHRLMGLWSLPFLLLMVVTGTWYLFESVGGRASYPTLPEVAEPRLSQQTQVTPPPLTVMLDQVKAMQPEFQVRRILFAHDAQQPLLIQGQVQTWLVRDKANHFAFNSFSGELLQHRKPQHLSVHARLSEAADPLHFGWPKGSYGFGWVRWLWFLLGAMLSALSLTGCHLYATKAFMSQPQRLNTSRWLITCWSMMGGLRWPLTALLLYVVITSAYQFL